MPEQLADDAAVDAVLAASRTLVAVTTRSLVPGSCRCWPCRCWSARPVSC